MAAQLLVGLVGAVLGGLLGHHLGWCLGDHLTPDTGLFMIRGLNIFGYAVLGATLGAVLGAFAALLWWRRRAVGRRPDAGHES